MSRLDKYLSEMTKYSRTEIKQFIRQKKITVNNEIVTKPEYKVNPQSDVIFMNGQQIIYEQYVYYMLNKPAGCVTATTDSRHDTVMKYIPDDRKDLFPVGRLDIDTEGLLIITNDGELAHRILSPKKHVYKTYYAKLAGKLTKDAIPLFENGIDIGEEKLTLPARLEIITSAEESEAMVQIQEGKFHQVKRMFHAVGCEVTYLKRMSMGALQLDDKLYPGECRRLTANEIQQLQE